MDVEFQAFAVICKRCGSDETVVEIGCGQNFGYVSIMCKSCWVEEYHGENGTSRIEE